MQILHAKDSDYYLQTLKYLTISMLMLNRLLRIKYLAYLWVKISAKDMSLPSEMHKYLLLRL